MRYILAAASAAALLSSPAHADGYFQVHGGVFQPTENTVSLESEDFFDSVLNVDVDTDADMGAAVGVLLGGYVLPYVAVEGEFTLRTATLDSADVESLTGALEDDLTTYAFMVNGVLRPDLPIPFLPDPYVGGGVGYVKPNFNAIGGDNVDGEFAYQLKAGASLDFFPTPGQLGVEVNYLATDDFDFSGDAGDGFVDAEFRYGGVTGLLTWRVGL